MMEGSCTRPRHRPPPEHRDLETRGSGAGGSTITMALEITGVSSPLDSSRSCTQAIVLPCFRAYENSNAPTRDVANLEFPICTFGCTYFVCSRLRS